MQPSRVVDIVGRTVVRHALAAPGGGIVVAVSGGADSSCLLHVLWTLAPAAGWRLHVAHLDHGLRGEDSSRDAALVADAAARLGLPCTVERRDVETHRRAHRQTLEEAAREVRYAFLADVATGEGAVAVATGHTADDSVETIVLHWLRGSGLAGARGIVPVRVLAQGVRLIRPLLDLTRADTESYCREAGIDFAVDATNADERVPRNRIRRRLLPELESYNPGLRRTLLRAATVAAADYDFVAGQVELAWSRAVTPGAAGTLQLDRRSFTAEHEAIQAGIVRESLTRLWGGWQDFGQVHVDAVRRAVAGGRVGIVVDLPHGLALAVGYESAWLGATRDAARALVGDVDLPVAPVEPLTLAAPGVTPLPGSTWRVVVEAASAGSQASEPMSVTVDADAVGAALWLRRPSPGDRMQPLGMAGTKKLQDMLVDAKVPRPGRATLPVVESGRGIVWVSGRPGLPAGQGSGWLAEWAKVRPETERAWRIRFARREDTPRSAANARLG